MDRQEEMHWDDELSQRWTAPDGVSFPAPSHSLLVLLSQFHSAQKLTISNGLIQTAEVCALEQLVPPPSVDLTLCNKISGKFVFLFITKKSHTKIMIEDYYFAGKINHSQLERARIKPA